MIALTFFGYLCNCLILPAMFKKYKLLIPVLVLLILSAYTFLNAGTDYSLTLQHYCALGSTIAFKPITKTQIIKWFSNSLNLEL